jgi:hypothetical protein
VRVARETYAWFARFEGDTATWQKGEPSGSPFCFSKLAEKNLSCGGRLMVPVMAFAAVMPAMMSVMRRRGVGFLRRIGFCGRLFQSLRCGCCLLRSG